MFCLSVLVVALAGCGGGAKSPKQQCEDNWRHELQTAGWSASTADTLASQFTKNYNGIC